VAAAGVVFAAFVKGAIGFGFPSIATPILALTHDVPTAVVVLLLPNLVMDGIQIVRRRGLIAALRRHAVLLACAVVGMVAGTQVLVRISPRALLAALGAMLLVTVGLAAARPAWRLPPRLERPLAPAVGLLIGLAGGITNVFGPMLAPYFYALDLAKAEFVRSMAMAFLALKGAQLVAVWQVKLVTGPALVASLGATVVGLAGFWAGLRVQDRIPAQAFNRAVLGFLAALGVSMLTRAAWP
jgi:uncharacterized membrane protein YfcA